MTWNQQLRQNSVRAVTGTSGTYEEDWHALFTVDGIAAGFFNDRLKAWINFRLSASYQFLADAMRAFAINQGATSWSELGTFTASSGSGVSDGILLENGTDFLMLEDGTSFLLLETVSAPTNAILLENGTDFMMLEDGSSYLLQEA